MSWLGWLRSRKDPEPQVPNTLHSVSDSAGLDVFASKAATIDNTPNEPHSDVPGLDLTEIYPRIWVCGLPYNAVTAVDACRNNVDELAHYLIEKYGVSHFLVFNMAPAEKCSYDPLKFGGQVLKFHPELDDSEYVRFDDGLPSIAETFRVCYCMKLFLDMDPANVVVLHDVNGRTRTAFAISCFLSWAHSDAFSVFSALTHFLDKRVSSSRRRELPHTWMETLTAFQTCLARPLPFRPRKLHLLKLVASLPGDITFGLRPPLVQIFQGPEIVFDSELAFENELGAGEEGEVEGTSAQANFIFDEGELKCQVQRFVEGDVQIHIYAELPRRQTLQLFPTPSGQLPVVDIDPSSMEDSVIIERKLVVKFAFHTTLLPSESIITLPATAISTDLPSRLIDRDGFRMNVCLLDPQAMPTSDPLSSGSAPVSDTLDPAKVYCEDGSIDWEFFADYLNLTDHAAQLAGVYHVVNSHSIFPESASVELLKREGFSETYLVLAALQLSNRNVDKALRLLKSDAFKRLQRPFAPARRSIPDKAATAAAVNQVHKRRSSRVGLEDGSSSSGAATPMKRAESTSALLPVLTTAVVQLQADNTKAQAANLLDPLAAHERVAQYLRQHLDLSSDVDAEPAAADASLSFLGDNWLRVAALFIASALAKAERVGGDTEPVKLDVLTMTQILERVKNRLQSSSEEPLLTEDAVSRALRAKATTDPQFAAIINVMQNQLFQTMRQRGDYVAGAPDENMLEVLGNVLDSIGEIKAESSQPFNSQSRNDVDSIIGSRATQSLNIAATSAPELPTIVDVLIPKLTLEAKKAVTTSGLPVPGASVAPGAILGAGGESPAVMAAKTDQPVCANEQESTTDVLEKYTKMLKMGVPLQAIHNKMKAEGLDPLLLQVETASRPSTNSSETVSGGTADIKPDAEHQAQFDKYKKMMKMGLPGDVILHKAKQDGLDEDAQLALSRALGIQLPHPAPRDRTAPATGAGKAIKELRQSQETHTSVEDRKRRLIQQLLEEQRAAASDAQKPLRESQAYGMYFRMLKVGVPEPVVQHKILLAKLDPRVVKHDPDQPFSPFSVALSDDTTYEKYFKMMKVGLPREVVEHKMRSEGANPLALELDATLPVPPSLPHVSLSEFEREEQTETAKRPRVQRKKLHWEALPADRISSKRTIWSDLDALDDEFYDDDFDKLFTQELTRIDKVATKTEPKSSAKIIHLIDGKRGRNVAIGLKKLKMPAQLLHHCLMSLSAVTGDGSRLSTEELTILEELLPTAEEVTQVKAFRGDRSKLAEAEQFFLAVADVPKAKLRAGALCFQSQYELKSKELSDKIACIQSATQAVKSSSRLRKVLDAILKLGNKLNAVDETSDATRAVTGFTMNSLLKVSQTKAFNNKVTLLHYLVSRLARVDPDSLELAADLTPCFAASRYTLEMLRGELAQLKQAFQGIERLVREQVKADGGLGRTRAGSAVGTKAQRVAALVSPTSFDGSDAPGRAERSSSIFLDIDFAEDSVQTEPTFPEFVARTQTSMAQIQEKLDATSSEFAELLEFFGESATMSTETFFGAVTAFCKAFDDARADNAAEEARAAREARRSSRSSLALPTTPQAVTDSSSSNSSPAISQSSPARPKVGFGPTKTPREALLASIASRRRLLDPADGGPATVPPGDAVPDSAVSAPRAPPEAVSLGQGISITSTVATPKADPDPRASLLSALLSKRAAVE